MMPRSLCIVLGVIVFLAGERSALARGCTEKSESRAVGYATCSHFGMWGQDRLGGELALAFTLHRLDVGNRTFAFCGDGKSCPPTTIGGDTSIRGAGASSVYGPSIGMLLDYGPFRFGPRIDFGWGAGSSAFVAPGIVPGDSSLFYANLGILLGAHASLGHVVVGIDVITGMSQLSVAFSNLAVPGSSSQKASAWDPNRFSLQPEVSALGYLHPFVGIGFAAGADVASRQEMHASVVFRFPLAPYEGTR